MGAIVSAVEENSAAQELQISRGDEIISINGIKPLDLIDYTFLIKTEELDLHIKRANGEEEIIEIEKDFDDDLGIIFESAIFDRIKPCVNNCIFCFVDQQPKGLRESLYVKDDDWRLSYLQGSYITLTNMTRKDYNRLQMLRIGPLYVSVHTTNPVLREKMMKNPRAKDILKELKKLEKLEIPIHSQIVLCPGFNDGRELEQTLTDLSRLKNVISTAIVPLGLTKFREEKLTPVTRETALATLEIAKRFDFVQCADEFFILAQKDFPSASYYKGYGQLEDGVGAVRMLLDDFDKRKNCLKDSKEIVEMTILTSKTGAFALNEIKRQIEQFKNLKLNLVEVSSSFWGEKITVTGLITGFDIVRTVKETGIKEFFISSVMLRPLDNEFLDGLSVKDIEKQTGAKIHVMKDNYSTHEIVEYFEVK